MSLSATVDFAVLVVLVLVSPAELSNSQLVAAGTCFRWVEAASKWPTAGLQRHPAALPPKETRLAT